MQRVLINTYFISSQKDIIIINTLIDQTAKNEWQPELQVLLETDIFCAKIRSFKESINDFVDNQ